MEYLKPCPFCGQEEAKVAHDVCTGEVVRCEYCGVLGEECSTEKQAIESWNKRVETELEQKYKWQVRDTCTRAERAEKENAMLKDALLKAKETIFALHGPVAWDIYDEHSPEMKLINAALGPIGKTVK